MTAGYSGTPLPQKLGVKPGHRLHVTGGAPAGFLEGWARVPLRAPIDVAIAFVTSERALRRHLERVLRVLAPNGAFWVAWPKRAAGVPTDLTEDVIRAIAVDMTALVDNKVCAIDETWSGLRLVVRKEHRAGWPVR